MPCPKSRLQTVAEGILCESQIDFSSVRLQAKPKQIDIDSHNDVGQL